ncbi:uncharacterized protein At2g29880-like [Phalaenopsis equestris]|uniref:uncharacterized protein At2g29880-like n=1 Tax=Phalaenopsis equestris TaxID=78828 RepID=UPI0009E35BBC|nr:uncharacterized protein At2g29880-like [Phalaenopsis equestris]
MGSIKKEWKIWKELKRGSTGFGWDPIKQTIDAPEEWWAQKLEVVPEAKKFKLSSIDPVLEEKLDGMFIGVVATETHVFTPISQNFDGLTHDMASEHIAHSGEGPSQIHTKVQSTGGTKRPRVVKKKIGAAFVKRFHRDDS